MVSSSEIHPVYSIVVPMYQAGPYVPSLLEALESLQSRLSGTLEVVFVIDGATDDSLSALEGALPSSSFASVLVTHSRNFGSLAALRTGLARTSGQFIATLSADLQEPPELILNMFEVLANNRADLVLGQRLLRDDPLFSRWMSDLFWIFYRRFIQSDIPPRGFDVFGCNRLFRDRFLELSESQNVMIGTLLWVGFRRQVIPYARRSNRHGRSTWTLLRKIKYAVDNVFLYSDFPVRAVFFFGFIAILVSLVGGLWFFYYGELNTRVMRYAPELLMGLLFTGLNAIGLGIVGSYVWRVLLSARRWPQAIIMGVRTYPGR